MNRAFKIMFTLVADLHLIVLAEGERTGPRPESFRHERTVLPGGPGPNRLTLDAAVLAGGRRFFVSREGEHEAAGEAAYVAEHGLGDFRIYDASGREVPYLLIRPPPSLACQVFRIRFCRVIRFGARRKLNSEDLAP